MRTLNILRKLPHKIKIVQKNLDCLTILGSFRREKFHLPEQPD